MKDVFGSHHGLDERSMDSLLGALERENLPGFDYLEFKQALVRLQDLNMEEVVAFKSAFATASTMGLTKEKLLKTAAHYRQVLTKEKQNFDAAVHKQLAAKVEAKRSEVAQLQKRMEDYKAKIAEMQAQLEKDQQVIAQADASIKEAEASILDVQQRFDTTLGSLLNQIDQDVNDINTHL